MSKEYVIFSGVVTAGRKIGRRLGFPTANINVGDDDTTRDGVYVSTTTVDGVDYRSVSNLGHNPSVGGVARGLETHLLDFDGDLYGKRINVRLLRRLRDEQKFASVEELQRRIAEDCITARNMEIEE